MLKNEELENNEIVSKEKLDDFSNTVVDGEEKENVKPEKARKSSKKKLEEKLETVVDSVVEEKDEVIEEETVIEKIKNFIAKIVAMQEEAQREEEILNEKEADNKEDIEKTNSKEEPKYLVEYYDLPYRYNETVVKILAQTPKKLFVYWDISDNDRQKYINTFGEDFFSKTYPVLLLYNEDKQYVNEIPINDFANSWYINIQDPKTKYIIQLGRKFKEEPQAYDMSMAQQQNIVLRTDYLPLADSNTMEAPNDHVLLETLPRFILFRNVKTNEQTLKDIRDLKDIFGNNYDVEEFYKNHYKDELNDGRFDMANPSSKLTSSTFK